MTTSLTPLPRPTDADSDPADFIHASAADRSSLAAVTALTAVLVAAFGWLAGTVWSNDSVSVRLKLGLSATFLLGTVLVFYLRHRLRRLRQRMWKSERERLQEAGRAELEQLTRQRGVLLGAVSREMAGVIETLRERVITTNDEMQWKDARRACVKRCLEGLCRVFESDPTVSGQERYETPSFKATLFVFDRSIGDKGGLRRAFWHYPRGRQPQTQEVDFSLHPNFGGVLCYQEKRPQILEDVTEEAQKGERWADVRPHQRDDYRHASMACIPVWGEVEGVVTVDTLVTRYFRAARDHQQFLEQIVGPFLEAIRLSYAVTDLLRRGDVSRSA